MQSRSANNDLQIKLSDLTTLHEEALEVIKTKSSQFQQVSQTLADMEIENRNLQEKLSTVDEQVIYLFIYFVYLFCFN